MAVLGPTRTTGLQATVGTVYSPGANVFKVIIQNVSNAAIDLRAEDDAIGEAVEQVLMEMNALAYHTTNDTSGTITVVMDKKVTADDLQHRIRGLGTTVGPNNIDVTGSDVTGASTVVAT
jgi:type II secretory pathway component GspD/PulD (secretin)